MKSKPKSAIRDGSAVGGASGLSRILRPLEVLERIGQAGRPLTVPELASSLGIPKASMARVVARLVEEGYVLALPDRRTYVPGPRAIGMARASLGNGSFRRECRALLRGLVETIGETCNIAMRDADEVVLLERVESNEPLRMHLEVGSRAPLHCTAGGKLFLALLPPAERSATIDALVLRRMTPRTITERPRLAEEIMKVQARGLGIDDEEFVLGMVGLAVPIPPSENDKPSSLERGSIALVCHAASARMSLSLLAAHVPVLTEAATRVGHLFANTRGERHD